MTDDLVGRLEAWADSDVEYGHHARSSDWLAAKARIEALEAALRPFAEAADDLDDKHRDSSPIWEAPAALRIDAGHLRDAQKLLAKGPPHAD